MSAAKHTPGPWDKGRAHGIGQVFNADGRKVCDVLTNLGDLNLIVFAPETAEKAMRFTMLVERYLQDGIDDGEPVPDLSEVAGEMYALRAHIAKATGSAA